MRQAAVLVCVFVAVFAYTIASQLASESRALVAGVVIGIVASIPAALISILVTARAPASGCQPAAPAQPMQSPPPLVIVNPGQAMHSARYAPYVDGLLDAPQARTFTISGDEDKQIR